MSAGPGLQTHFHLWKEVAAKEEGVSRRTSLILELVRGSELHLKLKMSLLGSYLTSPRLPESTIWAWHSSENKLLLTRKRSQV